MAWDISAENLPAGVHIVYMPKLTKTMEEAAIVGCPCKIGDKVKRVDVIFEVEADKATVEIESPFDGVVKEILVKEGDTVSVNYPLMILADEEVDVPKELIESLKKSNSVMKNKTRPSVVEDATSYNNAGEIVSAASEQTEMKYELGQVFTPSRMQKLTAGRMLKSKREIPCFYLTARVDVTELVKYRTGLNSKSEIKVSYNDFVIRAVALGLDKFELMTGQLDGDNIRLSETINISLAIDTPGGLVAPVITDADKKSVQKIAADTGRLIEKAKNKKLQPEDLEGACITVSNLGSFGVDSFIPIVIPGQCSILGVGQISETLLPEPKEPQVRKIMNLNLSVDHRVANGAYAGQFLDFVRKLLEDPTQF